MNQNQLAKWFLRIGMAFVLVYASVEIYVNPENFLKYVPKFMTNMVPLDLFLNSFGVIEVLLAVWLLSGWKGQYPSLLSALMMAGIVVFNMEYFQILFRNVAIGFGGLALIALELANEKKERLQATGRNLLAS
jgi:hypothetical protein